MSQAAPFPPHDEASFLSDEDCALVWNNTPREFWVDLMRTMAFGIRHRKYGEVKALAALRDGSVPTWKVGFEASGRPGQRDEEAARQKVRGKKS